MPGHLKSVMIVGILLLPICLSAQDMGGEDSPMKDNDSTMKEIPTGMSAAKKFESEGMEGDLLLQMKMPLKTMISQ